MTTKQLTRRQKRLLTVMLGVMGSDAMARPLARQSNMTVGSFRCTVGQLVKLGLAIPVTVEYAKMITMPDGEVYEPLVLTKGKGWRLTAEGIEAAPLEW